MKRRSVSRAPGLKTAASPFNRVKFEFGIVLLICLAVLLLLAGMQTTRQTDTLILLLVAGSGGLYIALRTRAELRRQRAGTAKEEAGHGPE